MRETGKKGKGNKERDGVALSGFVSTTSSFTIPPPTLGRSVLETDMATGRKEKRKERERDTHSEKRGVEETSRGDEYVNMSFLCLSINCHATETSPFLGDHLHHHLFCFLTAQHIPRRPTT
jgi:hypothetical protein